MSNIKPTGKITRDEWTVVTAVEQFWHEKKFFPGYDELAKITELDKSFIESVINSEQIQKRFTALGIDVNAVPLAKRGELKRNQTGLTDKQLAVAETILNPFDKRSHTLKLKSLGVLSVTFNGWRSNKTFADYMSKRAEDMFGDAMPMAQESLVRKMMSGDTSAIKLYMEMQGRYSKTGQQSSQDFRMLVLRLIEILQKHIRDPELLQRISEEIKFLIEPNQVTQVITQGEVVYDNSPIIP